MEQPQGVFGPVICNACNGSIPHGSAGFVLGPAAFPGGKPSIMVPPAKKSVIAQPGVPEPHELASCCFCSIECVMNKCITVYIAGINSQLHPLPARIASLHWLKETVKRLRMTVKGLKPEAVVQKKAEGS